MTDISKELLYDQIKAKEDFHHLINGSISHEMRNPLQSILAQSTNQVILLKDMKGRFDSLIDFLKQIDLLLYKLTEKSKFLEKGDYLKYLHHNMMKYKVIIKNFIKCE